MQCLRIETNAQKLGNKGYDQSVTCLADDLKTLETRSSMLGTPETLSQTNNRIHKNSSIDARVELRRKDPNRKYKGRASICKKNQSKWSYETQTTIKRSAEIKSS